MGFKYLDGKRWSQVTRDERFFCQRLYQLICDESAEAFVRYLCEALALDVEATGEWEAGFEVCFYRDLRQLRGRQEKPFSRKRTFDLCLFGEKAIVIIEAKAAVGFERAQVEESGHDIVEVQRLTGAEKVHLVGLCSSQCQVEPAHTAIFTGHILRWSELAVHYGDDPVLLRADAVYEPGRAFGKSGQHADLKLTGSALIEAFEGGAEWWVGRGGGLDGQRFRDDVTTGGWRTQKYEVNTSSSEPPSPNWFTLRDFAEAAQAAKTGSQQ